MKEEDIPAELYANSDQTQGNFAPSDKLTWAPTGSKQVTVIGGEEKCAFTILITITCAGLLLPIQAIYAGKTHHSWPSSSVRNYEDLINLGCLLQESGTSTYWSNHQMMHDFVDRILAPYFNAQKQKLGLPISQKALWSIDVWSVHRSAEFRQWMKENHPNIILDFILGGCTSIAQPCDVGIQRPFKHSMKKSYHKDIVAEVLEQLKAGEDVVTIDTRLPLLRDHSTHWLWNVYQTVNKEALVKKVNLVCSLRNVILTRELIGL